MDILIGLIIVALLGLGAYVVTHHKAPQTPAGADLANTLAAASSDAWKAVKRDLPIIVSAELAQTKAALSAALDRAQAAESKLAAAIEAHNASLAAVAARVAAAVTSDPALSPPPVAPAVTAAQAEDAAAVRELAAEIQPA